MKCLSVRQPWAWLILAGIKKVENRGWAVKHRGPLVIHAGKTYDRRADVPAGTVTPAPDTLAYGAVLGVVDVVECVDFRALLMRATERVTKLELALIRDPWARGPYCLLLRRPRLFDRPLPYAGKLGLFDVPAAVVNALTVGRFRR